MLAASRRFGWLLLGLAALALAAAGIVLPLLPTTPFLLVAAYAFARSSPRLHRWLMAHRLFGPMIHNWQERGAIPRKAKRLAVLMMAGAFALSLAMGLPWHVLAIQAVVLAGAGTFVLTRPDA